MKLFLVRHGIAVDGLSQEIKTDAQRPLTHEGIEESELVARGIKRAGSKIEHLISSPLVRARQTAEIFADTFKIERSQIEISQTLAPGGDHTELYKLLKGKKADSLALFGHEPDMSELAQNLLGAEFQIPFKKAGVCRIDVFEMPPVSAGTLKWFLTPKLARLIAR